LGIAKALLLVACETPPYKVVLGAMKNRVFLFISLLFVSSFYGQNQPAISESSSLSPIEEKARLEQLKKQAKKFPVQVIQVLPQGLLVDTLDAKVESGMTTDHNGKSQSTFFTTYSRSGKTIFIEGLPAGKAEDDKFQVLATRDGTFTYTDVSGASRTVAKWISFGESKVNQEWDAR
jgi:hypothetical protein